MQTEHPSPSPTLFLDACDVVNFHAPEVARLAVRLGVGDDTSIAQQCFRFVRDEIKHSSDYQLNPVTCTASEVLAHRTGFCYAKSHLLCALLRANGIPAGLSYQRLSIDGAGAPYCLHGLNAVYLPDCGWYRIDPRGNREGIQAEFCPPTERLAFVTELADEFDLPGIYATPLPTVVAALRTHETWDALSRNLPDVCRDVLKAGPNIKKEEQ